MAEATQCGKKCRAVQPSGPSCSPLVETEDTHWMVPGPGFSCKAPMWVLRIFVSECPDGAGIIVQEPQVHWLRAGVWTLPKELKMKPESL